MTDRVEMDIVVEADGDFRGRLPRKVEPGVHHVIIELDATPQDRGQRPPLKLPQVPFDVPSEEQQFRREDIYAGRH